jgi:hypothetical protein
MFSIVFIFWQEFHYVLFLEYISVDADDQDSDSSVDFNYVFMRKINDGKPKVSYYEIVQMTFWCVFKEWQLTEVRIKC